MSDTTGRRSEAGGLDRDSDEGGLLDKASAKAKDAVKAAAETARAAQDTVRKATATGRERIGATTRGVDDMRRRSAEGVSRQYREVSSFVEENPIMLGVAGLAAGLLLGSLLPGTRRENQILGRYADEAREQGARYARELVEEGKQMLVEAVPGAAAGREAS